MPLPFSSFRRFEKLAAILIAFLGAAQRSMAEEPPPNIIVIFTDDQGYADLGAHGILDDVRTPHLDKLAAGGVRFTDGYVTAPQCAPSRAALITGRYQQRCGFDSIADGPLPLTETTLAQRLKAAGYVTGMVGKWHLEPNAACAAWVKKNFPDAEKSSNGRVVVPPGADRPYVPGARGFDFYFHGEVKNYHANFDAAGRPLAQPRLVTDERFRVAVQTEAALAFLKQNADKPFFLYLAYYAPHVPLEATEDYLARFPGPMPERRRYGLAMISAVDDGVGAICRFLQEKDLTRRTLVVFASDNGAPLARTMPDTAPPTLGGPTWTGSRNDPLAGEKGMLAEGGIRVPFLMAMPGTLPEGMVYRQPVSTLDITPTALALAGRPEDPDLDGVNLLPFLQTEKKSPPHEALYWRFWNQGAIRAGQWKYLRVGSGEFLFDLESDAEEIHNRIAEHPDVAADLRVRLDRWAGSLRPPGVPDTPNRQEKENFAHYFHTEAAAPTDARKPAKE